MVYICICKCEEVGLMAPKILLNILRENRDCVFRAAQVDHVLKKCITAAKDTGIDAANAAIPTPKRNNGISGFPSVQAIYRAMQEGDLCPSFTPSIFIHLWNLKKGLTKSKSCATIIESEQSLSQQTQRRNVPKTLFHNMLLELKGR